VSLKAAYLWVDSDKGGPLLYLRHARWPSP